MLIKDIKTLIHGDAKNDQIEAIDQLVYSSTYSPQVNSTASLRPPSHKAVAGQATFSLHKRSREEIEIVEGK